MFQNILVSFTLAYMTLMEGATIVVLLMSLLHFHKVNAAELNSISDSEFLTDRDTLVSESGIFELGFFQPAGRSENKYLGIRYKNISVTTLVWVANKNHALPSSASSNVLKITNTGVLILFSNTSMIWSSNTTMTTSQNATAKLHDNGNLVLLDQHDMVIWQSFDYPTDTLLPGMKLGKDYSRGIEWRLSSWKTSQDPAPGEFTWGPEESGYPESKLKKGSLVIFRGGAWRNRRVRAVNFTSVYNIVITPKEKSFSYNDGNNSSVLGRVTLNSSGALEAWALVEEGKRWHPVLSLPIDTCDTYNICSYYGSCSINLLQQSCTCVDVKRFMPRNQKAWEMGDWSGGCVRRRPLECKNESEGFIKYSNVKLPDTQNTWFDMNMTLDECEIKCLNNCTCMAYANPDTVFKACVLWFEELKDIRVYSEGNVAGTDIYVRMASSELHNNETTIARPTYKKKRVNLKMILLVIIPGLAFISLISTWLWFAHKRRNHVRQMEGGGSSQDSKNQGEAFELLLFRFSRIATATCSFSPKNILGRGGFGPVYKGVLEEGLEIAVKRLSKSSSQGVDEFMNEVICISKLQHRNLVKLLGCCIKGDEKLLIYEYMPNGSLDSFIFDTTPGIFLDWAKRFDVINGISRGLVYLHQDPRLRIIHRDLKASNILLDLNMNPKISDFGIARSFGGNESQASTERVVGTYGYMSPEYALRGVFSIKSDVFSFGVLVLEIVSGKKNWGFSQAESENNLIGHAWNLYNEGRFMELIDADLAESCNPPEVLRSIQVGLLCVQHDAGDRPNMPSVIQMLSGEGALPHPKQPAFFMENQVRVADVPPSTCLHGSVSGLTITEVDAR